MSREPPSVLSQSGVDVREMAERLNTATAPDLTKIGGSDIATIAGINPFCTPYELWLRLTRGMDSRRVRQSAMWGTLMEPLIANTYAVSQGIQLGKLPSQTGVPLPYCRTSLDYQVAVGSGTTLHAPGDIIEIKNWDAYGRKSWENGVPPSIQCQCQWYMESLDRDVTWVVVLIGGNELFHFRLPRDRETGSLLLEHAKRFWEDFVLTGIPPAKTERDKKRT